MSRYTDERNQLNTARLTPCPSLHLRSLALICTIQRTYHGRNQHRGDKNRYTSVILLRNHFTILSALAVTGLLLLAFVVVTIRTATAQTTTTPTCANGTAVPDPDNNPGLVSDCEALLASRDTLAGTATLNWAVDTPVAQWEGVTLGGTPSRVTELQLPYSRLTGEIPAELGTIETLRRLDLSSNQLTGGIPEELGSLDNLERLELSENQLSGQIPSELGGLERLVLLILNKNQLTGDLPTTLGSLANLGNLLVADNMLTGELPPGLTRLTSLQILAYHNNAGLCAPINDAFQPVFPILGVLRFIGHPKRDGSIIIMPCEACQRSVWPIGSTIAIVNHTRCPFLLSPGPLLMGGGDLKTRRLPGAPSLLARSWFSSPSAWRR